MPASSRRSITPLNPLDVGRRERQLVEVVYRLGRASVSDVRDALPDPPSYSAVRAMLGKLVAKGHLAQEVDGPRYLYRPAVPAERARKTAMRQLVDTFFDGSVERAVVALANLSNTDVDPDRLDELAKRIRSARQEGR
jgi:predicted transcriptional regulator